MGPNDAEIIRVFTKRIAGTISDETLKTSEDFDVLVESEYGAAIAGIVSEIGVTVLDLTASNVIVNFPPISFNAIPGEKKDTFVVSKTLLTGRENHVCQIVAFLSLGIAVEPDASFATSSHFLLIKP
jgi:hypothetical protein